MRGYMFRSKWGALLFVAITLASVTKLVGTKSEEGSLQQATAEITHQRAAAEAIPERSPANQPSEASAVVYAPVTDADLIDPATGFDPSPVDPSVGKVADENDTVILLKDDDEPAEPAEQ